MPLSNQEIFTKVVLHLRGQGCQSINLCGMCLYRGKDSHSCAIGCLLPDEIYKGGLENRSITFLWHHYTEIKTLFESRQLPLLEKLQAMHDTTGYWGPSGLDLNGENRLREIGAEFKLLYSEPQPKPFS